MTLTNAPLLTVILHNLYQGPKPDALALTQEMLEEATAKGALR
jgi:hypothetical protein